MKTVQFDLIFDDVLRAAGRPARFSGQLDAADAEVVAQLVGEALSDFYDYGFWPGTFAVEQRTIDTDDLFVLKEADGETRIGRIEPEECFFEEEPKPGSLYGVLEQVEDRDDRIVCFDDDCPAQPYVRFQLPVPQFTRVAYAAGSTYVADVFVYDSTTGECYRSKQAANTGNAVTDTDWWEKQEFPALARTYVKLAASAELMAEDDGKYRQLANANKELEDKADRYLPRYRVGR